MAAGTGKFWAPAVDGIKVILVERGETGMPNGITGHTWTGSLSGTSSGLVAGIRIVLQPDRIHRWLDNRNRTTKSSVGYRRWRSKHSGNGGGWSRRWTG